MEAKVKISKSEVMKQAWKSYKLYNGFNERTKKYSKILLSFSVCLRRAWALIKELAAPAPKVTSIITQEGYNNFYSNTKYFGD